MRKKFSFMGAGLLLIALFSLSASAISQDDFCELLDENMTVSTCNDVWDLVNQQNNVTIYKNETFDVDSQKNVIFDSLEDDILDLVAEELIVEYNLSPYLKKEDFELYYSRYNGTGQKIQECDTLCQFKKQTQAQIEQEIYQKQQCSIYPDLSICSKSATEDKSLNNGSISITKEEVQTIVNAAISSFKTDLENSDSSSSQQNNILYIVGAIALVVGFVAYQKRDTIQGRIAMPEKQDPKNYELERLQEEARRRQTQLKTESSFKENTTKQTDSSKL